jgi:hypothetical protein
VSLRIVDVEVPGGERGVLLLWWHRFITDSWGWELPAGRLDDLRTASAMSGTRVELIKITGTSRPGSLVPVAVALQAGDHERPVLVDDDYRAGLAWGLHRLRGLAQSHEPHCRWDGEEGGDDEEDRQSSTIHCSFVTPQGRNTSSG